jgi:hypothetical protein
MTDLQRSVPANRIQKKLFRGSGFGMKTDDEQKSKEQSHAIEVGGPFPPTRRNLMFYTDGKLQFPVRVDSRMMDASSQTYWFRRFWVSH